MWLLLISYFVWNLCFFLWLRFYPLVCCLLICLPYIVDILYAIVFMESHLSLLIITLKIEFFGILLYCTALPPLHTYRLKAALKSEQWSIEGATLLIGSQLLVVK